MATTDTRCTDTYTYKQIDHYIRSSRPYRWEDDRRRRRAGRTGSVSVRLKLHLVKPVPVRVVQVRRPAAPSPSSPPIPTNRSAVWSVVYSSCPPPCQRRLPSLFLGGGGTRLTHRHRCSCAKIVGDVIWPIGAALFPFSSRFSYRWTSPLGERK